MFKRRPFKSSSYIQSVKIFFKLLFFTKIIYRQKHFFIILFLSIHVIARHASLRQGPLRDCKNGQHKQKYLGKNMSKTAQTKFCHKAKKNSHGAFCDKVMQTDKSRRYDVTKGHPEGVTGRTDLGRRL